MSTIAVPDMVVSRPRRKNAVFIVPALAVLVALGIYGGRKYFVAGPQGIAGTFQPVVRMDMDVKVTKDGELAAINNIEIVSQVEGSTTIQTLVKEGTYVKKGDLLVLEQYTFKKESTDRQNKLKQADRKLARTKKENASNTNQKEAAVSAAEEAQKGQKYTVEHLEKQLTACTIKAPSDGMVVYGSTGQQWYYRERPIQAGAQVNEQELLLRLPDTSKMKAIVKVPESWISKLKLDDKKPMTATVQIVGVAKPVTAKVTSVSVMADNSQRWFNPDARDYPVELTLDETPPGLKPGASAKAEINIEKLTNTLAVPMSAIYAVGSDKYVFIKDLLRGVRPAKVDLGQSNDTHVQITTGLTAGQDVLLLQVGQGRELLEKAGINPTSAPTTQPGTPNQQPPAPAAPVAIAH